MASNVWFITGTARGFGRIWAEAALARAGVHDRLAQEVAEFGEPPATARAVLQIVDADPPPLRRFLGADGMPAVRAACAAWLAEWAHGEALSNAARGTSVRQAITA